MQKQVSFVLPGLVSFEKDDIFDCHVLSVSADMMNNLVQGKWIQISPIKNSLQFPQDELIYKIIFAPMKPFKTVLDLLISKKTGGRWK